MTEQQNTPATLKKFFSVPGKPVDMQEMGDFWKSLTEEEKVYYRGADLG